MIFSDSDTQTLENVDVSDIFYFFSARGRGGVSPRCQEGGGFGCSLKIPGEEGCARRGGDRGAGSFSAGNFFWGGGVIFFLGAETQRKIKGQQLKGKIVS